MFSYYQSRFIKFIAFICILDVLWFSGVSVFAEEMFNEDEKGIKGKPFIYLKESLPSPEKEKILNEKKKEERKSLTPKEIKPLEKKDVQIEGISNDNLTLHTLQRYGSGFFVPARKRILEMEQMVIRGDYQLPTMEQRDALSGFVGPLEMVTSSVYATIPYRYTLTPGDQMTVSFWGKMLDLQKFTLILDENGEVTIPKVGKMVARGMTLDQFQNNLRSAMERITVKDLELIVSLDRLKSIQIFITGEVFRPGSYAVSAVTSLFNALFASGGPSDSGSLRDIRLLRNQQTIRIDFYDYLLKGESHNDIPLQAGDTIFIPAIAKSVSIEGEVNRPALFDLKDDENLEALIALAGGIKDTGILQKIEIKSTSPNKERFIKDLDMTKDKSLINQPLFDGDSVLIRHIISDITNMVTLEGKVTMPGAHELKEGMKVSDLFSGPSMLLGEAHKERADILRLNKDKRTRTLIPIDLGKAIANDPGNNILLESMDRIIVYSKWDVKFTPLRVVNIFGAVQRPGEYIRSDGMKLNDLLLVAGGPLPGYYEKMEIAKAWGLGGTKVEQIDLKALLNGDESQNISLDDEDVVMINKNSEFFDKPLFVTIEGEVRYPGTYPLRTRTEKISELIERAGGLTDLAFPKGTVFTRKKEYIPSGEQRGDLALVNNIINMVNDLDYERQLAKNRYLLMKEQRPPMQTPMSSSTAPIVSTGNAAEAAAIGMAPVTAQAAGQTVGGIIGAMETLPSVLSKARVFGDNELQPSERIIINMPEAISHPGGSEDMILIAGDTIKIGSRPTTVSVVGAVMRPTVITHVFKGEMDNYINLSGGYTEDANQKKTLVLRVDGSIIPVKKVKHIEEGDIIYVPPKVMGLEIIERIDKLIDVVKFTLVTTASVVTFIFLVDKFSK